MTQLKPFRETMTEIGNVFGFHDIQLDELEKYYKLEQQPDMNPFDKKRINTILFLKNYSDETEIMLHFVKLYIRSIHAVNDCANVGFIMNNVPYITVYSSFEKLVEYLVNCYQSHKDDTYSFILHFKSIELVELI